MKIIKLSTASRTLAEYAADLTDEIVLLTTGNRAVAAIVPLEGVDPDSIVLSGHPDFLKIIARGRAEIRRGVTMSLAEMRAALGVDRSPSTRSQPRKARRRAVKKAAGRTRLRG